MFSTYLGFATLYRYLYEFGSPILFHLYSCLGLLFLQEIFEFIGGWLAKQADEPSVIPYMMFSVHFCNKTCCTVLIGNITGGDIDIVSTLPLLMSNFIVAAALIVMLLNEFRFSSLLSNLTFARTTEVAKLHPKMRTTILAMHAVDNVEYEDALEHQESLLFYASSFISEFHSTWIVPIIYLVALNIVYMTPAAENLAGVKSDEFGWTPITNLYRANVVVLLGALAELILMGILAYLTSKRGIHFVELSIFIVRKYSLGSITVCAAVFTFFFGIAKLEMGCDLTFQFNWL